MINQVGNSAFKYSFVPFKGDGANIAVSKPISESKNDEFKKEEKKQKEQKTSHFGRSILAVALIAGLGIFGFSKFFSKGMGAKVEGLGKKLDRTKNTAGGIWGSFKELSKKSQVIFNIATLKDILFVKTLEKIPVLRDFNRIVTNAFERWSIATSTRAYNKTLISFHSMLGKFEDANKFIPNVQDRANVGKKIQNVRDYFYSGFGDAARKERLAHVQTNLKNLVKKVWKETYGNPKGFGRRALKGEFIAAKEANNAKVELFKSVMDARFKITNSPNDCYHATKDLWDKLHSQFHAKDRYANDVMKKIADNLNNYKKSLNAGLGSKAHFPKEEVLKDLQVLQEHIKKPNDYYDKDKIKLITEAIGSLGDSMSKTKQGEIQDIMDIYRKHLPKPEFDKLQKAVNKSMDKLNKATDMEHDKLFDKIRDLKLGSAPHDVLAFLGSLAVLGWGVSKADSKDEKISVTLKYAIPALVGVAMAIGCTVGLIASGPSLLIGLASTIPVNMIGKAIDNARKKKDENPQASLLPGFKLESPMQMIRDIEHNQQKKA